ncbi:MAG: hypothetical protein M0Q21_10175 [Ignavibacteriaceae bacterium]|nr:hypothetical protein [Ignavibacteriaceae bacterium]
MRRNKIIYSLCVGDIQDAAEDELNRKLTEEELKKVINRVGDYISWYDAIELTLSELNLEPAEEEDE